MKLAASYCNDSYTRMCSYLGIKNNLFHRLRLRKHYNNYLNNINKNKSEVLENNSKCSIELMEVQESKLEILPSEPSSKEICLEIEESKLEILPGEPSFKEICVEIEESKLEILASEPSFKEICLEISQESERDDECRLQVSTDFTPYEKYLS